MVKSKIENLKLIVLLMLFAIFFATVFFLVNNKKIYAESNNNIDNAEINYDLYTDSDNLLGNETKTIFDYPSLFATKSKIDVNENTNKFYILNNVDDDIVQIIPKALFCVEEENLYIGKEYGFYINTEFRSNYYFSTVLVFDINYNFNLVETIDNIVLQVQPIFQYNYIYLSKNNNVFLYKQNNVEENINYNIGSDIVIAAPSYAQKFNTNNKLSIKYELVNRYYLMDISFGLALYNEQELNYGDANYNPFQDIGSYITSYDYVFKGQKRKNSSFFDLNETYAEMIFEKLDSLTKKIGWLELIPFVNKFVGVPLNLLEMPELIYSWFRDVNSTLTSSEALTNVVFLGDNTGKLTVNSYYQNRDDQLQHYYDENNDPTLIKSATIPFNDILEDGVWHGVNDYATAYFKINHSALNQESNFTRVVSDITLKVMDSENDSLKLFGTSTRHDNMREPVYKQISMEESCNINLLPNGKNFFKFEPQFESDYEIIIPNSADMIVKLNNEVLNFVDNKTNIHLSSGSYLIEISNKNINNKLFSSIIINPKTINGTVSNSNLSIGSNEKYLIKIESLSQVKNIFVNNDNIIINAVYIDKDLNLYTAKGNIEPAQRISHPFILGNYYIELKNNSNTTINFDFQISEPETLVLNSNSNIQMQGNNFVYLKFNPSVSGEYVITASNMDNLEFNILQNDSNVSNAGGLYFSNYFYEIGCDNNKTYFIGIKNATDSINILKINKTEFAYEWQIINDGQNYITSADVYELKRNNTFTLNLLVNGNLVSNVIYGYDNQSTAFGNYSIITNSNQITINADCAVYGNGIVVMARMIEQNGEYINVDTLKIVPVFDDTINISNVHNDEDINFTLTSTKYITKIDYKLLPYNNIFTYSIDNVDATTNEINTNTISILNNIKSLNNVTPENLSLKIVNFYYLNAFNQEMCVNVSLLWNSKINNLFLDGLGTEESPYILNCIRHFENIINRNSYYSLIKSLNLSTNTPYSKFEGTLIGNNNTITFTIDIYSNLSEFGLFAKNYGTIKNLTVDSRIYNDSYDGDWIYVGGICGINYGSIFNCQSKGTFIIFRDQSQNGGIAGKNEGLIQQCTNYMPIQACGDIGGIAGSNYNNGQVVDCNNYGEITFMVYQTDRSVGGIVGFNYYGSVSNCENKGRIVVGGNSSNSRTLNPAISQIVGHCDANGFVSNNTRNGSVENYSLRTITWKTGIWPFQKTHSHNQAQFVNFTGEIGKKT